MLVYTKSKRQKTKSIDNDKPNKYIMAQRERKKTRKTEEKETEFVQKYIINLCRVSPCR